MGSASIKTVTGTGIPLRGNDIDTDRIIPARFLKCVTFDGLGEHAFEDDIADLKTKGHVHPFVDARYAGSSILVSNSNFGCGSSREHAPQSLKRWGINAIIAESYSEIFYGNCVSLGVPCFVATPEVADSIQSEMEKDPAAQWVLSLEASTARCKDRVFPLTIHPGARQQLLDGSWNARAELVSALEQVKDVAAHIPYVNQFAG
jgi:3-isopropylmalate/(R)-2-methylmalate dehydratase small subunit